MEFRKGCTRLNTLFKTLLYHIYTLLIYDFNKLISISCKEKNILIVYIYVFCLCRRLKNFKIMHIHLSYSISFVLLPIKFEFFVFFVVYL